MAENPVIKIAEADIGYTESPPNSNKTKYGAWYGLDGQPWCMMAVQYWFDKAGMPLPCKTASCSTLERWYRQNQPHCVHDTAKPGDIVIYDFGHTGIVEKVEGAMITAIEGNTSPGNKGSQNNGGGVYRRERPLSTVSAFIRPESEDTMTYERWKEFMKKYREELRDKPGSFWSEKERQWASENGIIRGDDNGRFMWQDFMTREQYAATEYRRAHEET